MSALILVIAILSFIGKGQDLECDANIACGDGEICDISSGTCQAVNCDNCGAAGYHHYVDGCNICTCIAGKERQCGTDLNCFAAGTPYCINIDDSCTSFGTCMPSMRCPMMTCSNANGDCGGCCGECRFQTNIASALVECTEIRNECPTDPVVDPVCESPETQVYNECASGCDLKQCGDGLSMCSAICKPGCECKDGYDYYSQEYTKCITAAQCLCDDTMELDNCASSSCPFQPICEGTQACTDDCVPGCKCKVGLIYSQALATCVSECPSECGVNMIPADCTSSSCPFEPICEEGIRACTYDCVAGCKCIDGYTYSETLSQCVSECPSETTQANACGINMIPNDCTSSTCPYGATCEHPIAPCTDDCVAGCSCIDGYTYSETLTQCVDQCPNIECVDTMEYAICISSSCNPGPQCGLPICTADCGGGPGCKCKTDTPFYDSLQEKCIALRDCPCQDPDTMQFSVCVSSSCAPGPSCENPPPGCTRDCSEECKCKDDTPYYSEILSKCVTDCDIVDETSTTEIVVTCEADERLVDDECVNINCDTCKTFNNGCQDCECRISSNIKNNAQCNDIQCVTQNQPFCTSCYDGYTLTDDKICVADGDDICSIDNFVQQAVAGIISCVVCKNPHVEQAHCVAVVDVLDDQYDLKDCFYAICENRLGCDRAFIQPRDNYKDFTCGCQMFECGDVGNGVSQMGVMIGIMFVVAMFGWM